jgi:hypothetical protein
MKTLKFQLIAIFSFFSFFCIGQESGKAIAITSCSCKPDQTLCQAESLFMSCCFCCQPGNTCGSWTAFGLCGCRCENASQPTESKSMNNINPVKFYFDKFSDFLNYLDLNKIPTMNFRNYAKKILVGKQLQKDSKGNEYYRIEGDELKNFTDSYLNDMNMLILSKTNSALIASYLKTNEQK